MVRERKHTAGVYERSRTRVHAFETTSNLESSTTKKTLATPNTSGKKIPSKLKQFPSAVKKRGNKIFACPEHAVENRHDVDFKRSTKRRDVNLSEVVTCADPTGEGLSNVALNQHSDVLNMCEFDRSATYPAEKSFNGDIPQCWLRESCMQLMDICEEVSYIEFLKPPRGLYRAHENGKEDEGGYKRDFVAFGKDMTSGSSYKQPNETNVHDKGDVIEDDLTYSSVEQHRNVIKEELETGSCDCCSMKDNKTEHCCQDSKEKLKLNGPYARIYCPCLKRGRNTKLKRQFCSLNSLENIYEVDEPESAVLHRQARSNVDIACCCDENANVWKDDKLSKSVETSQSESCVTLDKNKTGIARLHEAAKSGDVKEIDSLIENDVPVDGLGLFGWTPLYNALASNQIESAELLLNTGANPNFKHQQGKTVLHMMASLGNYTALEMLLDYGVEVNVVDKDGWPALHEAIRRNHFKCAALLMSSGADVAFYTAKRVEEYQMVLDRAKIYKSSSS